MNRYLLLAAACGLAAIMLFIAPQTVSAQDGWCSDANGGTTDCNAAGAIYHAAGDSSGDPPAPRNRAVAQPQAAPRERSTYTAPTRACKDGPVQDNGCYYNCRLDKVVCPATGAATPANGTGYRVDTKTGTINNSVGVPGYFSQGLAEFNAKSNMLSAADAASVGDMVDGQATDPLTGATYTYHAAVTNGTGHGCVQIGPNGPNRAFDCVK